MTARLRSRVALVGVLLAATGATGAAKPRRVETWRIASGTRLEMLAWPRGTPAPLELRVAKGPRNDSLPRLAGPRPEAMRVAFGVARSWSATVLSMYASGDSTRIVGGPRAATLVANAPGDSLGFAPVTGGDDVPDSVRVRFAARGRAVEVTLAAGEAWAIAFAIGEQANVLDPDGTADFARAHQPSQVDRDAGTSGATCRPRHPFAGQVRGPADVLVQFVIDTTGRVEQRTFRVLWQDGADVDAYVQAVVQALPCLRYRPAELRGRRVRLLAQQPFEFR